MPTIRKPRSGSLQYWPRKKARRPYVRVRNQYLPTEAKPAGFAGYKVGMTHAIITDNRKHSKTKGNEISIPVTILECPPLHVHSIRIYARADDGSLRVASEVAGKGGSKGVARKLRITKKDPAEKLAEAEKLLDKAAFVRINVISQPELTGVGKKTPEVFELGIGGDVKKQFEYAKSMLGKSIAVKDVFAEGQQVVLHGVTKGKGFQGPVKRFGVSLRSHKSEKVVRGPANVGPWGGNRSWTVAHAGQTGFHARVELNKQLISISDKPEAVNKKGGFKRYGNVKGTFIILRGSVMGASKRLVRLEHTHRKNKKYPAEAPAVTYISTASDQGR